MHELHFHHRRPLAVVAAADHRLRPLVGAVAAVDHRLRTLVEAVEVLVTEVHPALLAEVAVAAALPAFAWAPPVTQTNNEGSCHLLDSLLLRAEMAGAAAKRKE